MDTLLYLQQIPMEILFYLKQIPDVVWSGLLASFLTLSGVMLSNRSNTKRLRKQLSHDTEEKEKDRINSLRKDVYLKGAEEIAKVSAYLGKIPQMDPTQVNIGDGLSEFFAVAAKIRLVSQPETARLVGELCTRYGEILLSLLVKASPIHDISTEIRVAEGLRDRNKFEVDRVLVEMTNLRESGQSNPDRFAALNRSYEIARQETTFFSEELSRFYESRSAKVREYTIELLKEIRSIGDLQVRVEIAIRKELNLSANMIEYEIAMQENFERMDKSLREFLSELEGR